MRSKDKIGKIPECNENVTSVPEILQPPPTIRKFVDMNLNVKQNDIN